MVLTCFDMIYQCQILGFVRANMFCQSAEYQLKLSVSCLSTAAAGTTPTEATLLGIGQPFQTVKLVNHTNCRLCQPYKMLNTQ